MIDLPNKSKSRDVLVSLTEDGKFVRRFSAGNADPSSSGLFRGDASQCCLGLFLNLLFALGVAAPIGSRKSLFDCYQEVFEILRLKCVLVAEFQGAVKKRALNRGELLLYRFRDAVLGDEALPFLAWPVAPRQHHAGLGHVLRADFHPQ